MRTVTDVRADFPVLRRKVDTGQIIYLDNAATTLKPASVIDAVAGYYSEVSANIHRGKHILSEEASEEYERVRAQVAAHLGVAPRNIVFTTNTTAGLNLVASGLPVRPDDVVGMPVDSHHSAQLPWRSRCRIAWIDAGDGQMRGDDFVRVLDRRPAVMVFTACSNVTGHCADLERLVPMAQRAGAYTVVDAAQFAPHRPLRVLPEMDAVAFSAHKMLGPTGIGVLYLSDRLIDAMNVPPMLGGGTVDWVVDTEFRIRRAPYRFEPGTPNIGGVYGLGAALRYLDGIGAEALRDHDERMLKAALSEAEARPYLTVLGGYSAENRAAIVSVVVAGVDEPSEIARCLSDSYGVMCRSGFFCSQPYFQRYGHPAAIRIAPYIYNTEEEIGATFRALDSVYHVLRRG